MNTLPYSEAVSTAREIHLIQNLIPRPSKEHPWRVETMGALWRIVTRKLHQHFNDTSFEIRLGEAPESMNVVGMSSIVPDDKAAYVIISQKANKCWTRFAQAKELMHIYTNFYMDSKLEGSVMIGGAIKSRSNLPLSVNEPLDAETFCFLAAIELMIPWKYRKEIVSAKHNTRLSDYDIAVKLMIPEAMIAFFFSDDYENLSYNVNKQWKKRV